MNQRDILLSRKEALLDDIISAKNRQDELRALIVEMQTFIGEKRELLQKTLRELKELDETTQGI